MRGGVGLGLVVCAWLLLIGEASAASRSYPPPVKSCGSIENGSVRLAVGIDETNGGLMVACPTARVTMSLYLARAHATKWPEGDVGRTLDVVSAGRKFTCYTSRPDRVGWDYHCNLFPFDPEGDPDRRCRCWPTGAPLHAEAFRAPLRPRMRNRARGVFVNARPAQRCVTGRRLRPIWPSCEGRPRPLHIAHDPGVPPLVEGLTVHESDAGSNPAPRGPGQTKARRKAGLRVPRLHCPR